MIRKEIHTRADFASAEYYRIRASIIPGIDNIAGLKARKMNQAFRIFKHYQKEFSKALKA